jgi:3-deoxy-D-manno-octulosonate 8-phosphate phosphatase (KDO 8-P phosphatase)
MGDDVVDLAVLHRVGLSTAPADAVPEVRSRVHWVSQHGGGRGAVRELVETVLRAQNRWDAVVSSYLGEGQRG